MLAEIHHGGLTAMVYAQELDQKHLLNTVKLVRSYKGRYEATNFLNSLLVLLVLPNEKLFGRIPDVPIGQLAGWGIRVESVRSLGDEQHGNGHGPTLRRVVRNLRRAVSEMKVRPRYDDGLSPAFEFRTGGGFCAVLSAEELKTFVQNLATHLAEQLAGNGEIGRAGSIKGVRYVASVQRMPFHRLSCKCTRRIRPSNFQVIKTRRAAVSDGHRPCRFCKP